MARASVVACGLATLAFLLLLAHLTVPAPPALRLAATPHVCAVPCAVAVTIRLVPVETDRALDVTIDGPDYYRSSAWEIDGEQALLTYRIEWPDIPGGDYQVTANVRNGHGQARATAIDQVFVR